MGIALGLLAAVLYGGGDFAGGRAAEGVDVRRVLFVSQGSAALLAVPLAFVVHGEVVVADVLRGGAAGLLNVVGLGLLYRALANGRASVVAPLTAVAGALVPVTWGLATGERPGAIAVVGVLIAIGAGALLARGSDEHDSGDAGVVVALAAGAALGASFVCFAAVTDASGMWPILAGRVTAALAVGAALILAGGVSVRLPVPALRWALLAGLCDVTATVSLLTGLRQELAILVAAVAALAPGFTVVCAWALLRERLVRSQLLGVGLALVGLALIAAR